jgi:hypothetical protein
MHTVLQKLKQILRDYPSIWLIGLLFAPNNKAIIALLVVGAITTAIVIHDWFVGFYLTSLSSMVLAVGKWYTIEAIPGSYLLNDHYIDGYFVSWGIIPLNVILIGLLIVICRTEYHTFATLIKAFIQKHTKISIGFGSYFFITTVSSLQSPYPLLSCIHTLQQFQSVILFFATIYFCQYKSKFFQRYIGHLFWIVLFETALGIVQVITQSTLGIAVEFPDIAGFSTGTDQVNIFRAIGTLTNTNQFGIITYILGITTLKLVTRKKHNKKSPIIILALALLWNAVMSLSRSLWLGLLFMGIYYYPVIRNKFSWNFINKFRKQIYIFGSLSVILFPLICLRTIISTRTLTQYGGLSDRGKLLQEGIQAVINSPFLGTGVNTNEITLFRNQPSGIMTYFPTFVHNAYIQIAVDSGLIGLSCLLFGFIYLLNDYQHKSHSLFIIIIPIGVFYLFQPHIDYVDFPVIGSMLGFLLSKTHIKDDISNLQSPYEKKFLHQN